MAWSTCLLKRWRRFEILPERSWREVVAVRSPAGGDGSRPSALADRARFVGLERGHEPGEDLFASVVWTVIGRPARSLPRRCTIGRMFVPLSDKPDPNSHELAVLEFWDREEIFALVRAKNAEGPRFSFIDGPVTANKTLGVHTAWGRTLLRVFRSESSPGI